MNSSTVGTNRNSSQVLSGEALPFLEEGIDLVLSRWTALQMAVENGWGGHDSRTKSKEVASAIFSWFTQVKESLYIDDLENILDENMVHSFNAEINDGSIEEVAEQLMVIHEDLVQGNYTSIENLREASPMTNALSLSRQAMDDDMDKTSEEEESNMMTDGAPVTELGQDAAQVNIVPDEEGWCVVPSRRRR